jgi:hypothetical protein
MPFLDWLCACVAQEGTQALVVIWDAAAWHPCAEVAHGVEQQNRRAEPGAGVPVVSCELPVASPWRHNIEPCGTHAKKAVMDVDRTLTAGQIPNRVCEHVHCERLPDLKTDSVGDGARNSRSS